MEPGSSAMSDPLLFAFPPKHNRAERVFEAPAQPWPQETRGFPVANLDSSSFPAFAISQMILDLWTLPHLEQAVVRYGQRTQAVHLVSHLGLLENTRNLSVKPGFDTYLASASVVCRAVPLSLQRWKPIFARPESAPDRTVILRAQTRCFCRPATTDKNKFSAQKNS